LTILMKRRGLRKLVDAKGTFIL
jgi:hypothetical protein